MGPASLSAKPSRRRRLPKGGASRLATPSPPGTPSRSAAEGESTWIIPPRGRGLGRKRHHAGRYTTSYDHNAPTMPIVHPPATPPKRDLAGDELALQSSPITPQAAITRLTAIRRIPVTLKNAWFSAARPDTAKRRNGGAFEKSLNSGEPAETGGNRIRPDDHALSSCSTSGPPDFSPPPLASSRRTPPR